MPMSAIAILRAVALVAVSIFAGPGGCADDPPIKIRYKITDGAAQNCPGSCSNISVSCDAVLSVRIVDPAVDPTKPKATLVSVCERLSGVRSLCEMSRVRLPADLTLPQRRLAIQVALYNADEVTSPSGDLECPTDLPFDANNFASPSRHQPAVAGRGWYHPGDAETVVELGCADLTVVNTPACRGEDKVHVTASADDFDTREFLQPLTADKVTMSVAEPVARLDSVTQQTVHVMPNPSPIRNLNRVPGSLPAAWSAEIPLRVVEAACVELLEDTAASTRTLTCKRVSASENAIDLRALRLSRSTLAEVLTAIGETEFPQHGLVIGMVVDRLGNPTSNVAVRPSAGSVQYLGTNREISGTSTSSKGIFLSRDTPFNTSWTAPGTSGGYGGRVMDRVTMVILQPDASL
jgi:hypothetical protein